MKIALVGCGTMGADYHLPALLELVGPEQIWLADADRARAAALAEELGGAERGVAGHQELIGVVDAAIVAVPNDLHAEVACALLAEGIHVLCEKPLARTAAEAERILAAAAPGTVLRVGNVRRFYPKTQFLAHVIRAGLYGRPLRFAAEDGVPFRWPTASGFFLDRERAGGGVLIDTGVHVLDQLLFWLGPELELVAYEDDAFGGVESECRFELRAGSATGTVELSRSRRLANVIRLEFERGAVELPLSELAETITLTSSDGPGYTLTAGRRDDWRSAQVAQLRDFLAAVAGEPGLGAAGEDGLRVARFVDACYARRTQLDEPWLRPARRPVAAPPERPAARYRRILVTGASGFLGTRLCEQLRLDHGARVRGMIHTYERATRLARLDVELVQADLADPDGVAHAIEGCDAVVHCAIASGGPPDEYRLVTGRAAGGLAQAALDAGVRRFVHISSVGVYGYSPPVPDVDETTPSRYTGDLYCDSKLDAELEVLAAIERGLPAVVLRPTNIYGPYSKIFTIDPIEALTRGHVALAGDGLGPANTLYVDNAVHAIVLALTSDAALGETFIVSDEDGTTWRELYEAYAALSGRGVRSAPLATLYPDEAAGGTADGRTSLVDVAKRLAVYQPLVRAAGRVALAPFPRAKARLVEWAVSTTEAAEPPPPAEQFRPDEIPSRGFAEIQTSGALFRTDKIRSRLGFQPPVDFAAGMEQTARWLRYAGLV